MKQPDAPRAGAPSNCLSYAPSSLEPLKMSYEGTKKRAEPYKPSKRYRRCEARRFILQDKPSEKAATRMCW